MALTAQQQNFVSDLQALSNVLVGDTHTNGIKAEIDNLVARWNLNTLSGMADADIQALFPGLTLAKVTAAVTAIQALQTAFGDYVTGNATNLVKMKV